MKVLHFLFVGAFLGTFAHTFAASFNVQKRNGFRVDPVIEEISPVLLNISFYKNNEFSRSCFGAHVQKNEYYQPRWILPAECWDTTKYDSLSIEFGNNFYNGFLLEDRYELRAFTCVKHPEYNSETKAHNIAVVYTTPKVNKGYKIIDLPTESDDFSGKTLEVLHAIKKPLGELDIKEKVSFESVPINPNSGAPGWDTTSLTERDLGAPLIQRNGDSFKLVGIATTKTASSSMEFLMIQPYLNWIFP